ncbi:MAG: hypothetical protein V3W44_07190, partial [Dehalococcoidales bacterium]
AAVVAVVAGFVTRDVPISILYGLFVGTVFFVLREHRRVVSQQERQVSEMKNEALNLPSTFSHLENVDPHMRHLIERERSDLLRLAKEIAEGEISLRARPAWQIMLDFHKLAKPGDRIIATNAGGTWGIPQWDLLVQADCELADSGVDFTRIFIEPTNATPEYKKHLKQEMDRHKEGHINTRYIKESRLPPGVIQNGMLIVDKYCGYTVKGIGSGPKQTVEEVRLFTRNDEIEKWKEMMETVLKLSEEYK